MKLIILVCLTGSALALTGCSRLTGQIFASQQPARYDAAYCLKAAFEKKSRTEQNRAFLNDRLIELSRSIEDMAREDITRYQTIEAAYTQWSVGSGYGEDLAELDASSDEEVRNVLRQIEVFSKAAKPGFTVVFQPAHLARLNYRQRVPIKPNPAKPRARR